VPDEFPETIGSLVLLIDTFLAPGGPRTIAAANRIEVSLDLLLGGKDPFDAYIADLASYRPEGGEFLLDEDTLCGRLSVLRTLLVAESR